MTKPQILLLFSAAVLLAALFLFGPTTAQKKQPVDNHDHEAEAGLDFNKLKSGVFAQLSPARQQYLQGLEASVKRGDVKDQAIAVNLALANFWHDSIANPVLHYHYTAAASELVDSEKSLTFAAHQILGYLPYAHNVEEQVWLADLGKKLFDKALVLQPANDSSVVGLGGCLMYGAKAEGQQGTMAGILKVREVAEKDSTNLFAQYMLGIGGMNSGQFDKAALRFEKVAKGQPNNIEVLFKLAEAYEKAGNEAAAVDEYKAIAGRIDDKAMQAEIANRIKQLQQKAGK